MRNSFHCLVFILVCLLISSCSIESRLYTKGFHIEWNQKNPDSKKPNHSSAPEINEDQKTVSKEVAWRAPNLTLPQTEGITTSSAVVETRLEHQQQHTSASMHETVHVNITSVSTPAKDRAETQVSAADVVPQNKKLKRKLLRKFADDTLLYVILALLLPPLAVFLYEGQNWTDRCTLNLILTILCWLPGVIHALLVILDNR